MPRQTDSRLGIGGSTAFRRTARRRSAFTFRETFPPDENHVASIDETPFAPCPSV